MAVVGSGSLSLSLTFSSSKGFGFSRSWNTSCESKDDNSYPAWTVLGQQALLQSFQSLSKSMIFFSFLNALQIKDQLNKANIQIKSIWVFQHLLERICFRK